MTVVRNDLSISKLFAVDGPIGKNVRKTGVAVSNQAKRLCPVDTGRLRSSIQCSRATARGDAIVVRIGSRVKYARYVHDGTKNRDGSQRTPPRPFLKLALERVASRPVQ